MKRFRFSLQAVLALRHRLEHDATEQYARALIRRQEELERVHRAERDLGEIQNAIRQQLRDGAPAAALARLRACSGAREERRRTAATALAHAERETQAALQKMLEARRNREAIERFRSRQSARHQAREERIERNLMDELARRSPAATTPWQPAPQSALA